LDSASIFVLVNGSSTKTFIPTKGLRRGDPLVLLLFLIVVEGLARLVRQVVQNINLKGYRFGRTK